MLLLLLLTWSLLQVMWWMEQCAYISASRLRGHHLLTAGMDSVAFARPTHVGDIMYITAQVCGHGVGWTMNPNCRTRLENCRLARSAGWVCEMLACVRCCRPTIVYAPMLCRAHL